MTQSDLFGVTPLAKAVETGHQQATRAAQKADQASPGWLDMATELTAWYARKYAGGPFLMEQARAYAETQGLPKPTDPRAWGQVARRLKQAGQLEMVGFAAAVSSNGSPKCRWQWID